MASSCLQFFVLLAHLTISDHHIDRHKHSHPGIVHECSNHHQSIIKGVNLHKVHVPYDNHPFSKDRTPATPDHETSTRRSMLTQSDTSPIRISAYYDPTSVTSRLSDTYIAKLKASIGAIVGYYEKLIRVVPISDTFYMTRFCNRWYNTDYGRDCVLYNMGSSIYRCQYADIPDEHRPNQPLFYYNSTGDRNTSVRMLKGGPGISKTDLVLYVTNYATTSCSSGTTLAHAGPCAYDQYGRPIAGNINVCNYFFSDHQWKTVTDTMLHEMTHITIMLQELWDGFRDSSGEVIPEADVYDDSVVPPVLKSPLLLQTVRNFFNCPSATGLPVQNENSSHWHERFTFSEIMNPTTYSQQMYYSTFTVALMEDSGWYLPNYEYAMPFAFGRGAGCTWFTGDCIASNGESNFASYFCQSASDNGCNADHSAPSGCSYNTTNPPAEYQYFADPTKGGTAQSNYCPWRSPYSVANPDYEGVCHDVRGNRLETSPQYKETWGSTSRCTIIIGAGNKYGSCYEHDCYGWDGTKYAGVQITFEVNDVVDCARGDEGSTKSVSSTSNYVIECPNVDVVCGTSSGFGACYWGYYSDVEGKCICNPGYKGTDCNAKDNTTDIEIELMPITTAAPYDSFLCLDGFDAFDGQWNYVGEYDYNPVYQHGSSARYLWWFFWYHSWYISDSVGDNGWSSMDCQCSVSQYTTNISECNGQWKCPTTIQSQSQSKFGYCTSPPTSSPTAKPSKQTRDPTVDPTKPSINPTSTPTTSPTDVTLFPTQSTPEPSPNPTKRPTSNPTKRPTPNPTKIPTLNPTKRPMANPAPTPNPTYNPSASPTSNLSETPTPSPTKRSETPYTTSSPSPPPSTAPTAWEDCIDEQITLSEGTNAALQVFIRISAESEEVEITLIAPKSNWFAIGFGADEMNRTLAVTVAEVDGHIVATPFPLKYHAKGDAISNVLDDVTPVVIGSQRSITILKPWSNNGLFDFSDFFDGTRCRLPIIWAVGSGNAMGLGKHDPHNRGSVILQSCMCSQDPTDHPTDVPTGVPTTGEPTQAPTEDIQSNEVRIVCCDVLFVNNNMMNLFNLLHAFIFFSSC